ncbi:glycosyltransferase family 2 protein [Algoriphagus aquimarinus]|uniref:glycosyltransferase family 2 protein n=1 Tax=Algoriphagus aquimarinus TaxID=237018 RepID=UPI0030DA946B|tara:strand:- start:441 stop:1364 length:924 start_codon:yes stop_codon:yes gene_type:complete
MFKVLSIVVTHNGEKWLDKCFRSLCISNFKTDVYCIDNHSSDRTIELIKENYPLVMVKSLNENIGFGMANNLGLLYARENNYDYVFLLNQDAWVETNTLSELVNVSNTYKNYGVLSPIHLNGTGDRLDLKFSQYIGERHCSNYYSDLLLKKDINKVYSLPFVNAAAWLVTKSVLNNIGGFDPLFSHYGEDENFCQRLIYHGYSIGIVPNSVIYHDRPQKLDFFDKYKDLYFFERVMKVTIANVNNKNFDIVFQKEISRINSFIYASIITLDFNNFRRWRAYSVLLKKIMKSLKKSYLSNVLSGSNYI